MIAFTQFRQFFFVVLICLVGGNLAFAQDIIPTENRDNQRAHVDTTHNKEKNVDINKVNIVTPNSQGVSHNKFSKFNVSKDGVILNNSAFNVNTTLAGWVEGNPNLQPNREASLILNEVIAGPRSELRGYLEVAGKKADVIVANEAGILCNSCGFINVNRGTLTTGIPKFGSNGALSAFEVRQGTVRIEGGGLDARSIARLDVLARAAEIHAQVRAKNLNLVTGSNSISYDWSYDPTTGISTGITPIAGVGDVPVLAVDVAALGGMYANQIQLIATEQGVGVRVDGRMDASQGMYINSRGQLKFGAPSYVTGKKIRARVKGPIELEGILIGEDVELSSEQNIKNDGFTKATNVLTLEASTEITNTAFLISDGTMNIFADKVINGDENDPNAYGLIWAKDDLTIAKNAAGDLATEVANYHSKIESNTGDVTIKAVDIINQGKAPTITPEGRFSKWTEQGSAGAVDSLSQIKRFIDPQFLNADGSIKDDYVDEYIALWADLVSGGNNISPEAASILKSDVLNATGDGITTDNNFNQLWVQMNARASGDAGVSDPAGLVESMLDPSVFDINGDVKPEHQAAYAALWESLAKQDATPPAEVAGILKTSVLNTDGTYKSNFTDVWEKMQAGSGASYDIIHLLYQDIFNDDGKLAEIVAGGSIHINGTRIKNIYANISAGQDINLTADTVTNKALGASQILNEVHKRPDCFTCHTGNVEFHDTFGGVIEAGANINVTGNLENITEKSSTLSKNEAINRLNAYKAQLVAEGDTDLVGVANVAANNFEFHESRNNNFTAPKANVVDRKVLPENFIIDPSAGLTDTDTAPNSFVETRYPYVAYNDFITSRYMMNRLLYEQDLENNNREEVDALLADLNRYVNDGILSKELKEQLSGNIDVASMAQDLGISLPNGLLLSQQGPKRFTNGALIQAANVNIHAGTQVVNKGNIRADGDLIIAAIEREGQNQSDITIIGEGGSFITQLGRVDLQGQDILLSNSHVEGAELFLAANDNFVAKGVHFESDYDTTITGETVTIASQEIVNDYVWAGGQTHTVNHWTSSFDVGGDLNITSETDVILAGVDGVIEGDAAITAKDGELLITSVEQSLDYEKRGKRSLNQHRWIENIGTNLQIGGDATLSATGDITVKASTILAGLDEDTGGSLTAISGGAINVVNGTDNTYSHSYSKKKGFLKKKVTSETSYQETVVASVLGSSGDMVLISNDDISVVGSILDTQSIGDGSGDITLLAGYTVSDDGTVLKENENASINVIGASEKSSYHYYKKKSGLTAGGGFIGYKKTKQRDNLEQTVNVASVIASGGDLHMDATGVYNQVGSHANALGDVTVQADQGVNITPGHEDKKEEHYSKSSGFGLSVSFKNGFSLFLGYSKSKDHSKFQGLYNSASTLSGDGNVTIVSGADINQVGSDISAGEDLTLLAKGNLNSIESIDKETLETYHESLSIGITAQVTSSGYNAVQRVNQGLQDLGTGRGGVYSALTDAAALSNIALGVVGPAKDVAQAYYAGGKDGATNAIDKGIGLSASIGFGFDHAKSESRSYNEKARVSVLEAGRDLTIDVDENIRLRGTQVGALGDVTLKAKNVELTAAKTKQEFSSKSSSAGASIGVGFDISIADPAGSVNSALGGNVGITVSGYASKQKLNSESFNSINARVSAGEKLGVYTREDVRLHGGNFDARVAELDIGGNLDVISVQNTGYTKGKSSGFSASVTFSPAGVPSGGSLGINASKTNGKRQYTDSPSTITTRDELDITVGKKTTVKGGLINSETGKLKLSTGELELANLEDFDTYKRRGGGLNFGVGSNSEGGLVGQGLGGLTGFNFDVEEKEKTGITRATIGLGQIEIRDVSEQEAQDLLETLNRDPAKFQETLKDKHVYGHGSVDVRGLLELPGNLKIIGNFLKALATPVPEEVAAQGYEAEKLYKRMILNGLSVEQADSVIKTERFKQVVHTYNTMYEANKAGHELSTLELALIGQGEALLFGEASKFAGGSIKVPCPDSASTCEIALDKFKTILTDENKKAIILASLKKGGNEWKKIVAGDTSATDLTLQGWYMVMFRCAVEQPEIFNQFVQEFPDAYYGMGTALGFGKAELENLVETTRKDPKATEAIKEAWAKAGVWKRAGSRVLYEGTDLALTAHAVYEFAEKVSTDPEYRKHLTDNAKFIAQKLYDDPEVVIEALGKFAEGAPAAVKKEIQDLITTIKVGEATDVALLAVKVGTIVKTAAKGLGRNAVRMFDCTGNSFTANTLVWTGWNNRKAIGDLRVGDQVLARHEFTGQTALKFITDVMVHKDPVKIKVQLQNTRTGIVETIETTPEHPFYVAGQGFVNAEDLEANMKLGSVYGQDGYNGKLSKHTDTTGALTHKANALAGDRAKDKTSLALQLPTSNRTIPTEVVIKSVERQDVEFTAHNLTVDHYHTFFVGETGTWVHNANSKCLVNEIKDVEFAHKWNKDPLTSDNAFDFMKDLRRRATITDSKGGAGTVAISEINGKKYFGVNSHNLSKKDKKLAEEWEKKLGITSSFDRQMLFHAEAHTLMRVYKKSGGKLPKDMTLYVDRIACSSCQNNLHKLVEAMGIRNLTIKLPDGRFANVTREGFKGSWQK